MYPPYCSVKQITTNFSSIDWELHFRESKELTLQHYTPRKNQRVRQNPSPDKFFLRRGETGHRRCFFGSNPLIYKDCKSAASLSKSNNLQFLHLAPLSQLCIQKKLSQGLCLSEDPVIALSPRFCVTFCLCLCRSPAPSPTQAGTQSSLPLPPALYSHRPA